MSDIENSVLKPLIDLISKEENVIEINGKLYVDTDNSYEYTKKKSILNYLHKHMDTGGVFECFKYLNPKEFIELHKEIFTHIDEYGYGEYIFEEETYDGFLIEESKLFREYKYKNRESISDKFEKMLEETEKRNEKIPNWKKEILNSIDKKYCNCTINGKKYISKKYNWEFSIASEIIAYLEWMIFLHEKEYVGDDSECLAMKYAGEKEIIELFSIIFQATLDQETPNIHNEDIFEGVLLGSDIFKRIEKRGSKPIEDKFSDLLKED